LKRQLHGDPENANKGLKDRTIEDVFSESNKALKRLLGMVETSALAQERPE
jgi:hypothetical protein